MDLTEGVKEEDGVGLDTRRVEENRLAWLVKGIRVERRLNHNERIAHIFAEQAVSVERRLVGRVVEDLEELRTPEMEHELRVESKVRVQAEGGGVVLAIVGKARAETDEHAVDPAEDIWAVVDLGLEDCDAGHEDGCSFLVERVGEGEVASWAAQVTSNCRYPKVELAGRVLVVCEELDESLLLSWLLVLCRTRLVGNLEIHSNAGRWLHTAKLPRASVANTALRLSNRRRLFVQRNGVSNQTSNLELLGGENLQRGIEAHEEIVVGILVENFDKTLPKHGRRKAVGQNHMAASVVGQRLHFQKTDLVETAGKNVDNVAIVGGALRKVLVKLQMSEMHLGMPNILTLMAFL